MSGRLAVALFGAWTALVALYCGLTIAGVLDPASSIGGGSGNWLNIVVFVVFVLAFAVVGALIVSRHVRNAVGWLMLTSAFSFALAVGVARLACRRCRSGGLRCVGAAAGHARRVLAGGGQPARRGRRARTRRGCGRRPG